jgi:hypothetical protein
MFKPPRSRVFGHAWLLAGLALTSAWAETVNFTDNFSPPSSMWNNHTGDWTATGGDYYATVPNNAPFALTSLPFNLSSETLTVTVNSLGDSGILARTNASDSQYVLLILGGLGYGAGFRGGSSGTAIYWADSNNPNATYNEVTGVFTPGDTYTITVTAVGDTFSAFIDGASTPVTSLIDAAAGSAGEVGLYDDQPNTAEGGFGTPTSYSDFSVQGTTVPEPGGAGLLLGTVMLAIAWRRVRRVKLASASSANPQLGE